MYVSLYGAKKLKAELLLFVHLYLSMELTNIQFFFLRVVCACSKENEHIDDNVFEWYV